MHSFRGHKKDKSAGEDNEINKESQAKILAMKGITDGIDIKMEVRQGTTLSAFHLLC